MKTFMKKSVTPQIRHDVSTRVVIGSPSYMNLPAETLFRSSFGSWSHQDTPIEFLEQNPMAMKVNYSVNVLSLLYLPSMVEFSLGRAQHALI